jgi:hypothetical protein
MDDVPDFVSQGEAHAIGWHGLVRNTHGGRSDVENGDPFNV